MPLRSGLVSVAFRSFRKTRFRPGPVKSQCKSSADRNTTASSQGTLIRFVADCDLISDTRAFDFRLANRTGLSSEMTLPSGVVRVQVPASPRTRPWPTLDLDQEEALLGKDEAGQLRRSHRRWSGTRSSTTHGTDHDRAGPLEQSRAPVVHARTETA